MTPRIIPLEIHDQVNDLAYLLEAIEMMTYGIEDKDQQNAFIRIIAIAQIELARIEDNLERLDVAS